MDLLEKKAVWPILIICNIVGSNSDTDVLSVLMITVFTVSAVWLQEAIAAEDRARVLPRSVAFAGGSG